MALTKVNGLMLRKMIIAGANRLNEKKQTVDALNVFPVPDGDTGTNMSLTVLAAAKEVEKLNTLSISEMAKATANGALRGARGNSGVITSQIFRGFAKGLEGIEQAGTKELAQAFQQAAKTAYHAVMKPKEGTILTVAKACADSAKKAAEMTEDIDVFFQKIIEDGNAVLLQTKEMLPVLKQAGVVDAGGRGLLYILEGGYESRNSIESISLAQPSEKEEADFSALVSVENTSITFGYCTEFFILVKDVKESVVQNLKTYLSTIGDSIVCVSDEQMIKIHVHTDHPGLALEKALTIGQLSGLKIDNMRQQHTNRIDFSSNGSSQEKKEENKKFGFVAVSPGEGLTEIFQNLGVDEVIQGGQTMNPSTQDILNAIEKVPSDVVFILPNNKNIILASQQATELVKDKTVIVIPSKTIPQGISALVNTVEENIEQMKQSMIENMKDVTTISVTYAVRDTVFEGKDIKEGNIIGMQEDTITTVAESVKKCAEELLDQTVTEDTELISIYYGADVSQQEAQMIKQYAEEKFSDCEIELQKGGQPLYYYIISIE
ncbi:MAG TPA: DAK2 domain-containing protein [Candidatus Coprocola pullicola]|nr:DAK2 domain-containing protein [Candidatus Coprocola pullicola]